MTDRIPAELRERAAAAKATPNHDRKKNNATGARIIAAGVSVAAGVGMIGAMAAGAAANQPAAAPPPPKPTQRFIVIQQPVAAGTTAPVELPAAPAKLPRVVVVESTAAPAPASQPVTVTEGS